MRGVDAFDVEGRVGLGVAQALGIGQGVGEGLPAQAVTPQDIEIAQVFGYRIKLLGIAKRGGDGVELRVHPTLIPDDTLLAKVDGVLNAVVVHGNAVGEVGFYSAARIASLCAASTPSTSKVGSASA